MLKSWSIENFKPIVNSGELQFASVTVLAGKNSSGKSSLLQSILMIAQTLSNQSPDRALITNGPLVQLGTFEDVLNDFSNSPDLIIHFELVFESEDSRQKPVELYRTVHYKLAVTFTRAIQDITNYSAIEASKVLIKNVLLEFDFTYSGEDSSNETAKDMFFVKQISEEDLKRSLDEAPNELTPQQELFPRGDFYPRLLPYISGKPGYLGNFASDEVSEKYLISMSHFLPVDFLQLLKPSIDESSGYVNNLLRKQSDLEASSKQIKDFFTDHIRYLGPIRADPTTTRRTFAPSSQFDDVGENGEYAAIVYHSNQLAKIEWYDPQMRQVVKGTLRNALNTWVKYLGVAEEIKTEETGSLGVAWKVNIKPGQKDRSLTEVGVGVGQVLPVLVMGLLSASNTLLLMAQPELHLHPSVQSRLGDFFIGLAKCQKQCLIETHSENLVSQLRYHIVQAGGMDKSDCMIYFVDQDEKGAATFAPVEISPQGNILNWPEGFFDETMLQEDRITAASLRKRANKAKHG